MLMEHKSEFSVLKHLPPHKSADLNSIEHFCDVLEREIRILDVQETNLEELRVAIKKSWFQIKNKCF